MNMYKDDPFRRISLPLPQSRSLLSKYHPQIRPLPLSHSKDQPSTPTLAESPTIKEILKEKVRLLTDLNSSTNEQCFMQHRQQSNQKTLNALRKKWQRISNARKNHQNDQKQLDEAMDRWNKQIIHRNSQAKKEVTESRMRAINSKTRVHNLKTEIGHEVRKTSLKGREVVVQQKTRSTEMHKLMAESVRQKHQESLDRKRVSTERKRQCANEMKLERLQRQLNEKDEIKVIASHRTDRNRQLADRMRRQANAIQLKIDRFRNSLAERRLLPENKETSAGSCSTRRTVQKPRRSLTLNFTQPETFEC